jgi:hypothetical protein
MMSRYLNGVDVASAIGAKHRGVAIVGIDVPGPTRGSWLLFGGAMALMFAGGLWLGLKG